jgi:gluconolactonase
MRKYLGCDVLVGALALFLYFGCSHKDSQPALLATGGNGSSLGDDAGQGGTSGIGGSVSTQEAGQVSPICPPDTTYPVPDVAGKTATLIWADTAATGNLFEGPVWVAQENALYFSDMSASSSAVPTPSTIHELVLPDTVTDFYPGSGSNGLAVDGSGKIVACTHDTQSLSVFDPAAGTRDNLALSYQNQKFNSPNDLAISSSGTIYFTDPTYQNGNRASIGATNVYRVPAGTTDVLLVDGSLTQPNGITLSVDGTKLYVNDTPTSGGRVGVYPVNPDGSTGTRQDFAAVATPDGMTIDCAGNLYVASHNAGTVVVFSPSGTTLGTITVASKVTNLAFGGSDRKTLFITAGNGLYQLAMNLPGWPY